MSIENTRVRWLCAALKRLASAVQLRPWPPSIQSLTTNFRDFGIAALRKSATTAGKAIGEMSSMLDDIERRSVRSYDALSMGRVHQLPIHSQGIVSQPFAHEPNQVGPSEQRQNDAGRNLRWRENDAPHSITKCEQHAAQQKSARH